MRPTKIGSEIRFIWHTIVTDHRISFDERTWAITCDCGRVFYPMGTRKVLVIPLGPWEIRKVYGGRPPSSHYAPPTTSEISEGIDDRRR